MLAKQVSPPTEGIFTSRSTDPIGGSAENVLSLCQVSAPSPLGSVWSSTFISGGPPCSVRNGGGWISPKKRAKRICSSGVTSTSRKNRTRWSSQALRISSTVLSSKG